jgi:hypothetical protein
MRAASMSRRMMMIGGWGSDTYDLDAALLPPLKWSLRVEFIEYLCASAFGSHQKVYS